MGDSMMNARRGVCQTLFALGFCLAHAPALEPERPPEPWRKGVHPREAEWKKTRSYLEVRSGRACGLLEG